MGSKNVTIEHLNFEIEQYNPSTWHVHRVDTGAFWAAVTVDDKGGETFAVVIEATNRWGPVSYTADSRQHAVQQAMDDLAAEDWQLDEWAKQC